MKSELSIADMLRNLGSRFKELRLRHELTQKDLAESTCISVTTISKFENGKLYDISFSTLFKLLRVIEMDSNWQNILPDLPESPYMYKRSKKIQRIRK